VSGLRRRLQKLEEVIRVEAPSFGDQFAAVNQLAFGKLSAADRDLLRGGTKLRGDQHAEAREAAWSRWETALAAAVRETGCPFHIDAADWWLC